MEFLNCPDCGSSDFTEEFDCQNCHLSLLTGEKTRSKSNNKMPLPKKSALANEIPSRIIKQKIFNGVGIFIILTCLSAVIYSGFYGVKTKSLKTIASQLSVQNDLNKFAIQTNETENITTITLTDENVSLFSDTKPQSTVKLLFDCVITEKTLARTPDEYHITIISNDTERKNFESAKLEFQTEKEAFTLQNQKTDHWNAGDKSLEYATYSISRNNLENLASSTKANFQIGEYQGQLNFAQQKSIKSYLIATSIDSKVESENTN